MLGEINLTPSIVFKCKKNYESHKNATDFRGVSICTLYLLRWAQLVEDKGNRSKMSNWFKTSLYYASLKPG